MIRPEPGGGSARVCAWYALFGGIEAVDLDAFLIGGRHRPVAKVETQVTGTHDVVSRAAFERRG